MVFTKVMLLQGYVLSQKDVLSFIDYLKIFMGDVGNRHYKFLHTDFKEFDENKIREWISNKKAKINDLISRFMGIRLFSWPCCTKISDVYFLGVITKKYNRLRVRCNKCEKYSLCDTCIGQTENGFFDVSKILNTVFIVDDSHICQWCFNDKKEDVQQCKFCNYDKLIKAGMYLRQHNFRDERLEKWFNDSKLPTNFIYMLDDCLSCT